MRAIPLCVTVFTCVASAASAQDSPPPTAPSITVRGEASAEVTPDTVVVVFGVVTQGTAAAEAMARNSRDVAAAIAAIKAEGVEAKDIATTSADLTPQMSDADGEARRIVGYRAENQLQVRFKPADRAGAILGKIVDKGVNDVESVSAAVGDDGALHDKLKADAARNARREAEIYAAALDLKLGPVTRIEPEPSNVVARFAAASPKRMASAAVPLELGQQTVTEAVRVTFTLHP